MIVYFTLPNRISFSRSMDAVPRNGDLILYDQEFFEVSKVTWKMDHSPLMSDSVNVQAKRIKL